MTTIYDTDSEENRKTRLKYEKNKRFSGFRVFDTQFNSDLDIWSEVGISIEGGPTLEQLGYAVSLNDDGTRVAVGAPFYDFNKGRVAVYEWDGDIWNQVGLDIKGDQDNEQSGISVSLSEDGTIVALGSRFYDVNFINNNEGRARVYQFDGTTWNKIGDIKGANQNDYFGTSVALNNLGNKLAVGIPGYNVGSNTDVGRVQIYEYIGTIWGSLGFINGKVLGVLTPPTTSLAGSSVSLNGSGDRLAIGAPGYSGVTGNSSGYVEIYQYNGGVSWSILDTRIEGGQSNENFTSL
jgi:hypothetical protein